jgi:hypothetical protein
LSWTTHLVRYNLLISLSRLDRAPTSVKTIHSHPGPTFSHTEASAILRLEHSRSGAPADPIAIATTTRRLVRSPLPCWASTASNIRPWQAAWQQARPSLLPVLLTSPAFLHTHRTVPLSPTSLGKLRNQLRAHPFTDLAVHDPALIITYFCPPTSYLFLFTHAAKLRSLTLSLIHPS